MNKPKQSNLNKMPCTSQIHCLMENWAKSLQQPSLKLKTVFDDGSELIEEYQPSQKEIYYKVIYEDMEKYAVSVDIKGKYICNTGKHDKESLSVKKIIQAEKDFMIARGIKFKSITVIN